MKKLLKWIFYIFVGFMVLGYFASKNEPSSSTTSSGSTNAQETEPQREVFSTTARQLFKAYDENEVATDEKMKGKLISVKGVVQSIDKDFTDSIIISFRTDNEFMPARMEMEDSEKSAAIALKKGQQVTVICERMSRIVGAPSGRDCVFTH
ncbi:TPA: hypothetical protein JLF93_000353 [Escherichia coli]|nr:hypothetical protein [Escherichia coli]